MAIQVAADLSIPESNVSRWYLQARKHGAAAFPGSGHSHPREEELRRFKRELEATRMERDVLKKTLPSSRARSYEVLVYPRASA